MKKLALASLESPYDRTDLADLTQLSILAASFDFQRRSVLAMSAIGLEVAQQARWAPG